MVVPLLAFRIALILCGRLLTGGWKHSSVILVHIDMQQLLQMSIDMVHFVAGNSHQKIYDHLS